MQTNTCAHAQITKILDQYEALATHFVAFADADDAQSLWRLFSFTSLTFAQAMGDLKREIEALEPAPIKECVQ